MPAPAEANPFHEHIPRQALALAGWIAFWMVLEHLLRGQGLEDRIQLAVFLATLAAVGGAAVLAARSWLFRLLTSVRFAVTQGAFLIAAVALAMAAGRWDGPAALRGAQSFRSLWFCALLAVLAASMLTVTWKRRPYPLSRVGFLLVHVAPSLILPGTLWDRFAGDRGPGLWLIRTGCVSLVLGCVWMFYLKPGLKRREAASKGGRP
jgi:hypothetical protein